MELPILQGQILLVYLLQVKVIFLAFRLQKFLHRLGRYRRLGRRLHLLGEVSKDEMINFVDILELIIWTDERGVLMVLKLIMSMQLIQSVWKELTRRPTISM